LVFDLVRARVLTVCIISRFRTVETPDEPNYVEGYEFTGFKILAELNRIGRTAFTERLRDAIGTGIGGSSTKSPAIDDLVARRKRAMGSRLYVFYDPPLHMVRGEGVWLTDATGRRFLDCYNNVPHVGHCHPRVVAAITRQIRTLNTNTRYLGEQVLDYAERLGASLCGELKVCAFVNSGSEANDIAWRMAKAYTGNRGGLTQEFAYHGITDAVDAFSPSGSRTGAVAPHMRTLLAPDGYRGIHRYGTPDLAHRYATDADRAIASLAEAGLKPAAFIVDSAFMTNGVLEPQPGYVAEVFARVRQAGGLCIADEVQSGFGRMGQHLWGHNHHDVLPDIVTIGKPAGNGHPLGVVVTRPDIMDRFLEDTGFFSTFGGNNVSCAAGLAVLDVIEKEGLVENATITGAYLKAGIRDLMAKHDIIGDVRGTGLAIGVELVTDRKTLAPAKSETTRLLNLMRDEGVLIGSEGLLGNILKIRPPIVFNRANADLAVTALDRALARL
jgi:4-aminobutyrate aminotransferase-like enzyme